MDPAEARHALSAEGTILGNHKQAIVALFQNVAVLAQSITNLTQQMEQQVPSPPPSSPDATAAPASTVSSESYTCDPEPFDGDLNKQRGVDVSRRVAACIAGKRATTLLTVQEGHYIADCPVQPKD